MLLDAAYVAEKQQIPMLYFGMVRLKLEPIIYRTTRRAR